MRSGELGIDSVALQKRIGVPTSSFDNYWKGKRIWPTELLAELAEKLDTTVDALLLDPNSGSPLDLVTVNEIDLAYGLGGTYSDVPIEQQVLHFPRTWLESITTTPPSKLTFARGRGDSMQPTLQDGDIVLIDHSIRTIREQDAIWALTIGDIAMIKRVRIKGERVSLLSDNDRVSPDEVHHEELNVVGRVVFIGRRI
jgi:phage repressor protein C with HTH and peptisase S24 domain